MDHARRESLALRGLRLGLSNEVMRRLGMDASPGRVVVVTALATLLSATLLRSEVQMWQTNVLLMTALVLAVCALDGRPRLAGLLLVLAFNIKYLPFAFLPYLLFRRRYVAAAWFCIGIVAFALLPALASGWEQNLAHWRQALTGVAGLIGVTNHTVRAANVDPITAGHSMSITSVLSRMLTAAFGLQWLYAANRKPRFAWPEAEGQTAQPYAGLVALEWAALVSLILAFGPQTNRRHTSMLLMTFTPLAAMLCYPKPGVPRWPVMVGTAILFAGLNLPPNMPELVRQLSWWRWVGGAGWCMVLALPFYFIAGFLHLNAGQGAATCAATQTERRERRPPRSLEPA